MKALEARLRGDLEAEPFTPETLRLVEELIGFLRTSKVEVRLHRAEQRFVDPDWDI